MRPRSRISASCVLGIVAALSTATAVRADPPAAVAIEIDGEAKRTYGYAIEGTDTIGPTDLVWVSSAYRQYLVVRGSQSVLRYREDGDRLLQRLADGREVLVAFRAGPPKLGMSSPAVGPRHVENAAAPPPFGLSSSEIAGLQGLCIDSVSPDLDRLLAKIDPTKVPIVVDDGARAAIAKLPKATRYLVVDAARQDRGFDEPLPVFPALRLLNLRHTIPLRPADVDAISKSTGLLWLAISGRTPDLAPLQRLRALRVLDLDDVLTGPELDVSFVSSLASLRVIRLDRTRARDLSPLGGLAELASISARGAPIEVLPTGTLPALRYLDVIDTLVPPERSAAFARVRRACAVDATYRDALVRSAGAVDAVRVRSGGTCHRSESNEKVHATITEPKAVAEILASLEFTEGPVDGCMCCGGPTIELLRGGAVVASLGIHHGVALRWPGGNWRGDAVLRVESRARLFTRLTAAGVSNLEVPALPDPSRVAPRERRMARERQLLPMHALHVLRHIDWYENEDAHADVVDHAILKDADPIETCLRLMGLHGHAWLGARSSLRRRDAAQVLARIRAGLDDPELLRGGGGWLLRRARSHDESPTLPDEASSDRIILGMLGDPDPDVRREAIEGLGRREGAIAVRWIRRVLEGFVVTANPDPAAPRVAETAENLREAISSALSRRDAESLPRIRELVAAEGAEQRDALERKIAEAFPPPK